MKQHAANTEDLPLVYACSGCSNVAQLANRIAVAMDRERVAEMSCIAGVGGGVAALLRTARRGRRIIAIDGCHLHCTKACLARAEVAPDCHITLSNTGLRKRFGSDCNDADYAHARAVVDRCLLQKQHVQERAMPATLPVGRA